MNFMNLGIVRFTLLFFVLHAVTSDDSQISSVIQEILKEYNIQNGTAFEYDANTTFAAINFGEFEGDEKLKLHCEKLRLSHRLFEHLIVISNLRINITRQFTIMLNDIDEFQSALFHSLQETQPLLFDADEFEKIDLEDFLHSDSIREYQSYEYKKSSLQLQELKSQIYAWANDIQLEIDKSADITTIVHKFSKNEDIPQMPLKEMIKESIPKTENDYEDTNMQKIKKLLSETTDEKNEEPEEEETANEVQRDMYVQNRLAEETLPRWVPTVEDMEEIRDKYLKWMTLFEKSDDSRIKSLKESVISSGQSIKMFCRTLAEYFNITGIILECTSKGDTECEQIMRKILEQPHLKKFIDFFTAWGNS